MGLTKDPIHTNCVPCYLLDSEPDIFLETQLYLGEVVEVDVDVEEGSGKAGDVASSEDGVELECTKKRLLVNCQTQLWMKRHRPRATPVKNLVYRPFFKANTILCSSMLPLQQIFNNVGKILTSHLALIAFCQSRHRAQCKSCTREHLDRQGR